MTTRILDNGPVLCAFRRVTGLPCPGCGMTRATALLVRGRPRAAVEHHPLAPGILLILAVEVLRRTPLRRVIDPWLERLGEQVGRIPRPVRVAAVAAGSIGWTAWVILRWRRAGEQGS